MSIHKLVRLADKFEGKIRKQAQGTGVDAAPSKGAVSAKPAEPAGEGSSGGFPAKKKQSLAISELQKSLEYFRSVANKELDKAKSDYRSKVLSQSHPGTSPKLDSDPVYQDYDKLGYLVFSASEPVIADGILGPTTIKNINMVKKIPACFTSSESQNPVYKNIKDTLTGSLMMQAIASLNKGTDSGYLNAANNLNTVATNLSIGAAID